MKYQVVLDTVDDVLYEGSKSECQAVYQAFTRYNSAKNIVLREKEVGKINEQLKSEMIDLMVEWDYDIQDGGSIKDMMVYGCHGYTEMDDEEFVDYFEQFVDSTDEHADLLAEARAQLVIEEVLS